jgi:hypothetical protein
LTSFWRHFFGAQFIFWILPPNLQSGARCRWRTKTEKRWRVSIKKWHRLLCRI